MIRFEEATPQTYVDWGFKCGLEIHQQLKTARKLFCRCPVLPYSDHVDAEILRHMRPTLSELGEYDGTALMEFKTRKNVIYQLDNRNVCTYEMDDTPPFELNREALAIALEIALLLNCSIVSELHIARKQYLDGSIPTGFQRTTIVGVEGRIPVGDCPVRIIQLGLEEDACREVSDIGHFRTYRTDRLGIPLVETVTYPDMRNPQEAAAAAHVIRYLTRATGKVRTGIGAARQDVNVSVTGGCRVEIKGVPKIRMIPRLVHNEALRQRALLEIREQLHRRGITKQSFASLSCEVTELLRATAFGPITQAVAQGWTVMGVVLRGFRGILGHPTQPGTVFAKEIIDRVRVIACLDQFPNLVHSDAMGEHLLSGEWARLRRAAGCRDADTMVITWGSQDDVRRAVEETEIRAREATIGIPSETRQALSDGTNGFERILPGPDRMYPDTDLPPLAVTEAMIRQAVERLPERPWEKQRRFEELGVPSQMAEILSRSRWNRLFERLCREAGATPLRAARYLTMTLPSLTRQVQADNGLDFDEIVELVRVAVQHDLDDCQAKALTAGMLAGRWTKPQCGLESLQMTHLDEQEAAYLIDRVIEETDLSRAPVEKRHRHLMGIIMSRLRGRLTGRRAAELLDQRLEARTVGAEIRPAEGD